MRALRVSKLIACILGFLALTGVLGAQQQSSSPCQNPTVMVGRDEDLQQVIDRAPEGAVLQLPANSTYLTSLRITKSLTLCGVERSTNKLRGPAIQWNIFGTPAVYINSEHPIQVALYNLTIVGTALENPPHGEEDYVGLVIKGRVQVQLHNVAVSGHSSNGILIGDSAVVTLSQVWITKNGFSSPTTGSGMVISRFAQATIEDSQIFENARSGIIITAFPNPTGPIQVTLRRSLVSGNRWGIIISPSSLRVNQASVPVQITIEDSNISLNLATGIDISAYTEREAPPVRLSVSIANSRVAANGNAGVSINSEDGVSQVTAELRGLTVEGNGANPLYCWRPDAETVDGLLCDGIRVGSQKGIQVTIADTTSQWNAGWGIAVRLKKCNSYYIAETFEGQLLLEGTNVFERNNTAGYHEGEVCLP